LSHTPLQHSVKAAHVAPPGLQSVDPPALVPLEADAELLLAAPAPLDVLPLESSSRDLRDSLPHATATQAAANKNPARNFGITARCTRV
jgi:hypothetical protein